MSGVYVTRELPASILQPLRERFEVGLWLGDQPVPTDELLARVADAEGLLCMLNDEIGVELLNASPSLRVISQMAVGVDNIDLEECSRREIAVGHTPGVLTETVADTAFALLSSVVRRLPEGSEEVRTGLWGPWSPFHLNGGDLHGTTLGIVGMGRIGRAVARRAKGFDMSVVYSAPTKVDSVDAKRLELEALLTVSDNVVICVALTKTTKALIGTTEFGLMKQSAYLINVARGPIVDTDALVAALRDGEIAGVGLDVTDPEPLPPEHPLLGYPNCLVVPHIGSASVKTRHQMAKLAVQNLIAGLDGMSMPARYPFAG